MVLLLGALSTVSTLSIVFCFTEREERKLIDTYVSAHKYGTDIFAVSLENSLELSAKWSWDFYVFLVCGWPNASDDPPTNFVTQAAEQNKDTVVQNIEAILDANPDGTHVLGLSAFSSEGYDPITELFLDVYYPSRVAERTSKWTDERALDVTRLVILYCSDSRD